jgi:hypothetical protein
MVWLSLSSAADSSIISRAAPKEEIPSQKSRHSLVHLPSLGLPDNNRSGYGQLSSYTGVSDMSFAVPMMKIF